MSPVISEVFGRIVHKHQVEQALLDTLARWNQTYLTEMEKQADRPNPLQRPRFMRVKSIQKFDEDHFPLVMVRASGVPRGRTQRAAGGAYRAPFTVELVAFSAAKDEDASNELAGLYLAAAKAALVQQPDLGGIAQSVVWVGDDYDRVPVDRLRRTVAVAAAELEIEIRDLLTADGGPLDPDPDPDDHPEDWPDVASTELDVIRTDGAGHQTEENPA